MKYRHKAQCLVCGHNDMVFHDSKDDYQEIRVCPKCNGAYVDVWKVHKCLKETNSEKNSKTNLEIKASLDLDTDKMQLKLRSIAKHTGALADELDMIDNSFTVNEQREQHGLNPIQDGDTLLCKIEGSE